MFFRVDIFKFFIVTLLVLGIKEAAIDDVHAIEWKIKKSPHFIIHYQSATDRAWIQKVSNKAEYYYRRIASDIGYARYHNFWTWDDRVKIYIYADQQTFSEKTGLPAWSKGATPRDSTVITSRVIFTYKQEKDFLDGVLPHEISHLILRDFIGFGKYVPRWFDEGVAQLQEEHKRNLALKAMGGIIKQNHHMPLRKLFAHNVRLEIDTRRVAIYYVQSISLLDFLMRRYGSYNFSELCQALKHGKNFEDALTKAYTNIFDSVEELEKKWISDVTQGNGILSTY